MACAPSALVYIKSCKHEQDASQRELDDIELETLIIIKLVYVSFVFAVYQFPWLCSRCRPLCIHSMVTRIVFRSK